MKHRPVARRSAFTLLELLLTLSVLAAIAAVAIPQTGILLGDRRLVRAGDQLRVEMTRLRVDAMREGRVMMLEGMVEGNSFRVKPFYSVTDSTEAMDQTGSQSGLLSGATQGVVVPVDTDDSAERTVELPVNVVLDSVAVVSAARASEIEQLAQADQGEGWSRPILFYPDGSTSTAAISLSRETVGRIVVKIRGITGDVTVSEVLAPRASQGHRHADNVGPAADSRFWKSCSPSRSWAVRSLCSAGSRTRESRLPAKHVIYRSPVCCAKPNCPSCCLTA